MNRRVVITGQGVLSPLGISTEEFWTNCLQAKNIVAPIPEHWWDYSDFSSTIWAPLPEIDFSSWGLPRVIVMQTDPVSLMAICAAKEALNNARLPIALRDKRSRAYSVENIGSDRSGVFMGTGIGGANSFLENHYHPILARHKSALGDLICSNDLSPKHKTVLSEITKKMFHLPRVNPFVVSMLMPNAVSARLGITFSLRGQNMTYCLACAAGTAAIGEAFRAIRAGKIDLALAGGAEYLYDHYGYIYKGFDVAGALIKDCRYSAKANRPFDVGRSGFLFSQGAAAVLVLEELERAKQRGAPILAEVIGYGESFDACSVMAIDPEGRQIERMLRVALRDASITADDVDYVNAHGTGTDSNDAIEASILNRVFGDRPYINSTKSLVGHTIGASGAVEAVICVLSLHRQTTHICKNLVNPIANLNFVREVSAQKLSIALSQSFAFGGHNAALVLKRYIA